MSDRDMIDETRRAFLRAAGASILGATCASTLSACGRALPGEPAPGALSAKRWAMTIDVQRCLQHGHECRDCIDACHLAHNVPAMPDPRHEIKWLWKERYERAFAVEEHDVGFTAAALRDKPMLVLCNHCENPPCVRVCPTGATWRRPDGLVMMDEHRCIGCRYCVVGCPYGSRSFNWLDPRPHIRQLNAEFPTRTRGVVEKCNFCVDRLAHGRLPACVEACERIGVAAIRFGDLGSSSSVVGADVRSRLTLRRKPQLGTSPHVFYIV